MADFQLPELRRVPLVDKEGLPTLVHQKWWQDLVTNLRGALTDLQDQLTAIQAAQAAADAAQTTANSVATANAISSSFISPSSVLIGTDAGSDATISISDFTRYYPDIGTSVNITSIPDITGLSYTTQYYIYYDDATLANTSPTFVATTNSLICRHNYVAGRHYVDTILTPAAAGSPTSGGGYSPPGGGEIVP